MHILKQVGYEWKTKGNLCVRSFSRYKRVWSRLRSFSI
ncbi:hypothetical protein LINPERHAP1_LOCUS21506 [Linum perenne]